MKAIRSNKQVEVSRELLNDIISKYKKIHVDFGTGDGRYVYKNALQNPDNFYIGVDPSAKQLEVYSKKAIKDKLENTLFVLGSVEVFTDELIGVADSVSVILPWGSLLKAIVDADIIAFSKMFSLLKSFGGQSGDDLSSSLHEQTFEMIFGYHQDTEPSEVLRLNLENIDEQYIREKILPVFIDVGFKNVSVSKLSKEALGNFETTWSKRLRFGNDRPIYRVFGSLG